MSDHVQDSDLHFGLVQVFLVILDHFDCNWSLTVLVVNALKHLPERTFSQDLL